MRSRSTLLLAPVLVAGSMIGLAAAARGDVPNAASVVHVTSGNATQNIDAHFKNAAGIKGTVRNAAGKPIGGAVLWAFRNGHLVGGAGTNASGVYLIKRLVAGTYQVCATGPTNGGPATGYLGSCYGGGYFRGSRSAPASASKFRLASGQVKTGKNIELRLGAAVSGRVTSPRGAGVAATVYAHNRSTGGTIIVPTNGEGGYKVKSLRASAKGYTVCFTPDEQLGKTGLLPRCYRKTAWNGGNSYPRTATRVSVKRGKTTTGISTTLTRAGAIAGTVTDASTGNPLAWQVVSLFGPNGRGLHKMVTDNKGDYVFKGLAAATGYRVCVYGQNLSDTLRYQGECWKNVAWNGGPPPSGATGISVHVRKIHTEINFKLSKVMRPITWGTISGKITEVASGQPLENAEIEVFTADGEHRNGTITAADGTYTVQPQANSTGYIICVRPDAGTTSTTPKPDPGGWAPRCYNTTGGTAWNGATVPSDATKLPISAGAELTGVDIALRVGGAISGSLFVGDGPATAGYIAVYLFTAGGKKITRTEDPQYGTYFFTNLAPKFGYKVCFDGRLDDQSPRGYRPQCYDTVEWSGPLRPAGFD